MKRLTTRLAACLLTLTPTLFVQSVCCREEPPVPPARVDRPGDPLPNGVLARMGSARLDCEESIRSAAFAPDGKSLSVLTAAANRQLWYFDVATGQTVRRLSVPEGPRQHALTPDLRFQVVLTFYQRQADPGRAGARNFAEIHVLDGATGKLVWKTNPRHEFYSMALSADGKVMAGGSAGAGGEANKVFLWDTATGEERAALGGHPAPVTALAFSADGKKLLSASSATRRFSTTPTAVQGSVRVWELPARKLVKQTALTGTQPVFSPTGKTLAFHDLEETKLHLWDLDADREIAALSVAGPDVLFAPDGRSLVTGSATDMLRLWDAATGRELRPFRGLLGNGTRPLAFSADGKLLATCSNYWSHDSTIRLWDVARGTELRPVGGHHLDISCLAFSADGQRLISGSDDQTARIWETASGKELMRHEKHEAPVTAVAFSADGRTVASGDRANVTHIWDATTGKLLHRLQSGLEAARGTHPAICTLNFSADGKTLWVGSRVVSVPEGVILAERGELALYETATGKRIRSFQHADSSPRAVSPDGSLSAWTVRGKVAGGLRWHQKTLVRRLDTGRELLRIAPDEFRQKEEVNQVIFSPDGRLLALHSSWLAEAIHRSAVVPCYRLVEVASGRDIVNESMRDLSWTVFTAGGRVLAGAHRIELPLAPVGGVMREQSPALSVVDAVTKQVVGKLPGHPMTTNTWAVAPGGRFFASANPNHTILVWDLTRQGFK